MVLYPVLSKQDTKQDTKLKSVILSDIRIPWNVSYHESQIGKTLSEKLQSLNFSTTCFAINTGLIVTESY